MTTVDIQVASAKTAMSRTRVSAPLRWLLANDLIKGRTCNYGEGRAFIDTEEMFWATGNCYAYDPNSSNPYARVIPADILFDTVYCGYVLNTLDARTAAQVIEAVRERLTPNGIAYFAVRTDHVVGEPYLDGVLTKRGTFQMSYRPYTSSSKTYDWLYKASNYAIFTIRRNT